MPSQDPPKACTAVRAMEPLPPIDQDRTYLFASQPATPKDKPADILVRFQAVSRDHPAVDVKTIFISSRCTLLETRRILHKFFSSTYDRGFIFLQHGREVLRHKERFLRLVDVMPRFPLGMPNNFFKFPDVQYKKLSVDKDGSRAWSHFAGIVFLCEKAAHERWQRTQLSRELNADRIDGFSFLPGNIWSAKASVLDNKVETICELAALGSHKKLSKELENIPEDVSADTFRDNYLATPLHYACNKGDVGTAEIIVGRFGREMLYLQDWQGRTALHKAIYSNRLDLLSYLLNLGPDLQIKDNLGNSCHRLILSFCDFDTEYLLSKLVLSVLESTLILHFINFAFKQKNVEMCRKLCDYVHPVGAPFYRPPLHQAAELGDVEVVEKLLQHWENTRIVYTDENYFDNISILSEDYRPNNDPRDSKSYADVYPHEHGNTPRNSIPEVAKTATKGKNMPKKKPDLDIISDLDVILDEVGEKHRPDIYDSDGHLPYHYACQHGNRDVIGHLYYDSMDIKDFNKGIKLALNWKRFSALKILANLRSDLVFDGEFLSTLVKEIDKDLGKRGPFMLPLLRQKPLILTRFVPQAAATNDIDVLQLLLDMKVPMACSDLMGRTPLHEACQQGKEAAVRFLLLHGADVTARDWRGSTPLHYACAAGQLDIVCVLATREKVDLACLDKCQRSPILVAAQCRRHDILLYLIAEHASRTELLRPDSNGDCVLNYLYDFDEDLCKIVLEAAVKQKETSQQSLARPYVAPCHKTDNDVIEAWSNHFQQHNTDDVRADIQRKPMRTKANQITCLKCGKKRTTLFKLTRWTHLCVPSLPTRGNKQNKRPRVIYSVKDVTTPRKVPTEHVTQPTASNTASTKQDKKEKKKNKNKTAIAPPPPPPVPTTPTTPNQPANPTDITGNVKFKLSTINIPQQYNNSIPKNIKTPLDVLISKRKWDLIPDLLVHFPTLRRVTRSAYHAARLADARVIKILHKAENFSKESFTVLLHVALLNAPKDNRGKDKLVKCVKFLLKMGAKPNYGPIRENFDMDSITAVEMSLFPFMPLEIAALTDNEKLIDVLIENEASASICFAVHIAALKGNLEIVQKLIPHWREGRWKPYIKGFKEDATELVRVCTLESGVVQAVCASDNVSLELLACVKDGEKGVFNCKKILTHHMVHQMRPDICSLDKPSLMNKILYKHTEDVKRGEHNHARQDLFLTNLLSGKRRKFLPHSLIDTLGSFLVDSDCYLGEIRVSKKSTIHVVCESFVMAVRKRMWKTLESILMKGGNTLWKCLLISHHTCHKFAFSDWIDDSHCPCLSEGMIRAIHDMPLRLLEVFFEIGKRAMNRNVMKAIKDKINIQNEEGNEEETKVSKGSTDTPRQENVLRDVILYHVRKMPSNTKGNLLILAKMTSLFPNIFPITLEPLRFSPSRYNWYTASQLNPTKQSLSSTPKITTSHIIKHLRHENLELRLWNLMVNLPTRDSTAVQEKGLSLLHIACLQNDHRIATACLTIVVPLSPNLPENSGLTPMDLAASRGNVKILNLLKQYGGVGGNCILVAACVGKGFLSGMSISSAAKEKDSVNLQESKIKVLDWLFQNLRDKLNLAYKHPDHGTMFDVILRRHAWTLLDWVLDNAGTEACAAVMCRCSNLKHLAFARSDLFKKLATSHLEIIEKMPFEDLREIILKLSAFPGSNLAEFLLKKMVSLKMLPDQEKILSILNHKGSHREGILHNACRTGNTSLVKCVITTLGKEVTSVKAILEIIDYPDKSGCTPLWYSLAFRFWKLAEYLIVNGAQLRSKRSIPGLWNKRMFEEIPGENAVVQPRKQRSFLAPTQLRRSNSSHMADLISPASVIFRDLYLDDSNTSKAPDTPKTPRISDRSNKAHITPRITKPKVDNTPKQTQQQHPRLVQDDMESVGYIPSPRAPLTPRSARTVLPALELDMQMTTMSPRKNYPDDDEDDEISKQNIQKKKRVRYLLSLVHFARINKGTLLHAAASVGNFLLLKGILACPLVVVHKEKWPTFSPFLYSLVNSNPASTKFCVENGLGPFDYDAFMEVLCFLIVKRYKFEANHKTLKRLLNRFTIAKETIRGIKIMLLPRSDRMRSLYIRGTLLDTVENFEVDDEFLKSLIPMAIQQAKGEVSSRLLMTLAATGSYTLFTSVCEAVNDMTKLTEIFKRDVVHRATFLDLVFILSPSRLFPSMHEKEYAERMNIISSIASVIRLEITPRTLSAAIKKNLLPMLEMVVQDYTRNNTLLQPPDIWYEAIFKAASNGEIAFINTICVAEMNTKQTTMQAAMLKSLCIACQKRHRAVANRLLLFKMPLNARVEGVPGRFPEKPRLALDCAIEGGDAVIASLILQTMEETGAKPTKEDTLQCISYAFDKGMEPIVDNLLRFAHFSSPSLVTIRACHWLFLASSRHGNGMVCMKFLDLPEFNCNASDDSGFTAMHYASMHGKETLIREIAKRSEDAINTRTPRGLSPLDLARAFGHIDLGFRMVMELGALQGAGFGAMMTQSWLTRYLNANKQLGESKTLLMSPHGSSSRSMDIVTLVRQGNDMASRGVLEVAQESALACMLFDYDSYPLLHLCAQTGCHMTLGILLQLISAQPKLELSSYLLKERKKKIPLCIAIQNCNIECVSLLTDSFYPEEWRYDPTGESILHFAAKTNNEEIIHVVTEKANFAFLQAQDRDGLIPATTSIALGNHATVKYFLNGLRFAEKMHHEHTTTTYWCILCLLDCCIGWSKVFLESNEVALNGKGRNIFLRHRTESGFCVYSHKGNKANVSHTLDSVHKWIQHGGSRDLISSTLATMQYSLNGFKSELFLLLSQMTRFEAMEKLIKIGKNEVACYLYEKLCPTLEKSDKVDHFVNAVAYGRLPVVKKILELSGDEMSKLKFKGQYSALDVAVAFGHKELFHVITHAFEATSSLNSLQFLEDESSASFLPQEVKWNLGKSKIGDTEWRESIDYDKTRLSQVDVFLLKKPSVNSFPETLLPRDIMPHSFKGRVIEVNHQSMSAAILELGVTDTWLTSLLVSKTVLGRYFGDVVETSDAWQGVEKIVLSCVTPTTGSGARVELKDNALLDVVQVGKTKNSHGDPTFQVSTSSFPTELTPYHGLKDRILDDVIPSVQKKIREELFGLNFEITVDWNTMEASHDFIVQRQLLLALEGKGHCGPVAGLLHAVRMCGEMLNDVEVLYNRETVMNMLSLFESVKEIQVKYIRVFPKAKDSIWLPNEGKIIWNFCLEDGRPKFITSTFSLSILTQMFHTVAVCLSHSTRMFLTDTNDISSAFVSREKHCRRTRVLSPRPPTLIIKWRSFMFLNRLKILTPFVGDAVAPHITLIAAQYKSMLRLQMSVHTIVIQNTMTEEEAGVSFDDGVLLITIHSFTITHKPWSVTPLDCSKFFNDMEVTYLTKRWRAGSVNVTASRHRALTYLLENLGFPIDLPMAGQNILEMLCRLESRQMVHPFELLKMFGSALYKHISQGYVHSVISKLSFCRQSWFVGACKAPSGVYSWVRCHSLSDLALVHQILVYYLKPGYKRPKFELMTKNQVIKLSSTRIFGLWYKISTLNIYETLKHSAIDQAQLIVIKGKAFLIIASSFVESFLTNLPETVSVGFQSSSSHTKCISFDDAFVKPLDLFTESDNKKSAQYSKPTTTMSVQSYDFLTWQLGISNGFNVIFENQDFSSGEDKPNLPRSFYISYATHCTFKEVVDFNLYEKAVRDVMISIFRKLVSVTIGTSVPSKCSDLVTGDDFDESADVYILSDRDMHVMCRGTMWAGHGAGSSYSQTMLVAICSLFMQQTKARISNVLARNINRTINPSDITFRERVTSADQVSTLSTTRTSVRALEKSINRILTMSSTGTRKLKMDLTGVEFSEHQSGPMVTFSSGVLRCSLFKVKEEVDQKTMDRDFLMAVDEEEGKRMMAQFDFNDSRMGHRQRRSSIGMDDLYSITASEVLTINKEQSVLDKQRIAKHHSDDSHVVLRAVKRLFSGVEIGRTSDIMDSLDIGANVNSVNENGETPLIVAAKSRNYTIIDLLLTRGASTQLADLLGVTALHYESGQGDNEAVRLMLSYGADPNAQDAFGRTPLHYAVVRSHLETIDLLVFCGGDASIVNKEGESANSLAQSKAIKRTLKETDLIIRGLKTGNVSIEHLTLQADTIYRMAGTGLTIRTPSGMGLAKTSLMVRRVVPEYSLYGPQPDDFELLLSDVYDFRISGACVEEPLLMQIPVYTKAEQYEDILIKTNDNVYHTPIRIGRVVTQNKQNPQWMCHASLCLHGVKSIVLVTRPKAERFSVKPSGYDFTSVLDPLFRLQFQKGSVVRDCDVVLEVTSKPSYEEEDYDSILSMSHIYDVRSSNNLSLHDDVIVAMPLPENYLGHGVLHVLMRQQASYHDNQRQSSNWVELHRNPDYAKDVVTIRMPSFGQLCLMERNPHYKHPTVPDMRIEPAVMASSLYDKAKRREYSACFLAMAKVRVGKKSETEAEVVVECILSSKIHARLQHWKTQGFVDMKPSFTTEFRTVPTQRFVVMAEGPCEQTGVVMPPLQFHPKRNNCVKFLVRQRETSGHKQGRIDIALVTRILESPRVAKQHLLSQSIESLQTEGNRSRHVEEPLASIPLFLQWTAEPGDTRGQDCLEKVVLSPFDAAVIKADIRGTASPTSSELPESTALQQATNGEVVNGQTPQPSQTSKTSHQVQQAPTAIVNQTIAEEKEETPASTTTTTATAKTTPAAAGTPATTQSRHRPKTSGSGGSKSSRRDGRVRVATPGRFIRSISPVRKMSMPAAEVFPTEDSSTMSQCSSTPQGDGGLLDWLAEDLGQDWLRMGVMLGVPYTILHAWALESHLSDRHRAMKMLHHWKNIRSGRPDHGVPELLMTLQRINKTSLVHSLKTKLKTWIDDNLEKKGHLKAVVNKSLLEDTEILEPMSPLFFLALARQVGFRVDLMYDLGLSRPEVTWVMADPFLKHREDKMLGLLMMFKGKAQSSYEALQSLLSTLKKDGNMAAHDWILATSRQWLMHQGSADDNFAHAIGQMLQDKITQGETIE